jgi:hypothetical protein
MNNCCTTYEHEVTNKLNAITNWKMSNINDKEEAMRTYLKDEFLLLKTKGMNNEARKFSQQRHRA